MSTKICAIIGFYQDGIAGKRLIKCLDSYDIPSVWGDGRIKGFAQISNSNTSTDGFREIIKSYKNTTLIDVGLHGPGDLINILLQTAADLEFDYTFTFGCDEYITGDFELLKTNLERLDWKVPTRGKVPIIEHNPEHNNNQKHIAERITFMPKYVMVKGIHWLFYSWYNGEDRMLGVEHQDPVVFGVDLHHDDTIRQPWRNQLMDKFQEQQVSRERGDLYKIITDVQRENLEKRRKSPWIKSKIGNTNV